MTLGFLRLMRTYKLPISTLLLLAYTLLGGLGAASSVNVCRDVDGTSRIETASNRCCGEERPASEPFDNDARDRADGVAGSDTCVDIPLAWGSDQNVSRATSVSCLSLALDFLPVSLPVPHSAGIPTFRLFGAQRDADSLPATAARTALRHIVLVC